MVKKEQEMDDLRERIVALPLLQKKESFIEHQLLQKGLQLAQSTIYKRLNP